MCIQTWGDTQEFGGAGKREIYLSDDLNMLASKPGCHYHIYPSITPKNAKLSQHLCDPEPETLIPNPYFRSDAKYDVKG